MLLSKRDQEIRKRTGAPADSAEAAARQAPDWEQAQLVRREINSLVAQVAARTGESQAVVHVNVRKAVPGPPSANAPLDVLLARRDHLLAHPSP